MSAHYFIGIKSPVNFDNLIDTYKAKYQLTESIQSNSTSR